jgi:hypothetical protein
MDNISNNNTFIEHFYNHLNMDWKYYWLYYSYYILNLAVKYGLYGIKKEKGILVNAVLEAYWYKQENKAALVLKAQIYTEYINKKAIKKQRKAWH